MNDATAIQYVNILTQMHEVEEVEKVITSLHTGRIMNVLFPAAHNLHSYKGNFDDTYIKMYTARAFPIHFFRSIIHPVAN